MINGQDTEVLNDDELSEQDLIRFFHRKIKYEPIDPQKKLDEDIKKAKEKYGKDPDTKVVGMHTTGAPILAWMIDADIISDIGVTIFFNQEGQQVMQFVRLL